MRNQYGVVPFTQDHLESAVRLFAQDYGRERDSSSLLPSRVIEDLRHLTIPHPLEEFQELGCFNGDGDHEYIYPRVSERLNRTL